MAALLRPRHGPSQSREFLGAARLPAPIVVVSVPAGTGTARAAFRQRQTRRLVREKTDGPHRTRRVTTGVGGHDGNGVPWTRPVGSRLARRCAGSMLLQHERNPPSVSVDADLPGAVTVSARSCLLADLKANPERRRWLSLGSGFKSSDDS